MKSNKYSWHLRNTDTNQDISSCPAAPGTLWALVGSKLAPGTPALRGTYLHVQPSLERPGPHLHPAWFLPGCSCGQQCPAPASQPPPSKAERPGQMPPGAAGTTELCQQTPSAFELLPAPYFGKLSQGGSSSHLWWCGSVSFNACTCLRGAPLDHTCPQCPAWCPDTAKAGKPQGPAWQGHTERAHGKGTGQMVSTHTVRRKHCFIA